MKIARALTIAGSDSGAGAGIQADLKTFAALGVYGMSAVTAVTAQNTASIRCVVELEAEFVSAQIRAVVEDMGVDAVKTGMLASAAIVSQVARDIRELDLEKLVVDPVTMSKGGEYLLSRSAMIPLVQELFPLATVVTPNLAEASVLADLRVEDESGMKEAARRIKALGPRYVLVKGGHLSGAPVDLLYDGRAFRVYAGPRYHTHHTHGTGCTYASAIAAGLALGYDVEEAVEKAKAFIAVAIEHGLPLGKGHGPVHHFFDLYSAAGLSIEN